MKTKIDTLFAMAISRSPRYAELAEPRRKTTYARAHGEIFDENVDCKVDVLAHVLLKIFRQNVCKT